MTPERDHRARPARRAPRARGARRRSRSGSATRSRAPSTLIAHSTGRVIVAGVGKSGLDRPQDRRDAHVDRHAGGLPPPGRRACTATSASSARDDVAILISKSGESDELLVAARTSQGLRGTHDRDHRASRARRSPGMCDVALDAWVREEACPHDLAPTTSTTAALALGDALAVALLEHKGFRREDFARLHPGGALGRRLLTRVDEVMITRSAAGAAAGLDAARRRSCVLAEQRGIVLVVGRRPAVGGRAHGGRSHAGSWNTRRTCCPIPWSAS